MQGPVWWRVYYKVQAALIAAYGDTSGYQHISEKLTNELLSAGTNEEDAITAIPEIIKG